MPHHKPLVCTVILIIELPLSASVITYEHIKLYVNSMFIYTVIVGVITYAHIKL